MLVFVLIIFNNYIIFPYAMAFGWSTAPMLPIPPEMWTLLTVGLGGYIASRGGEKMMKSYKESQNG